MTFANASGNKLSDEALLLLLSEFADLVASKRSLSAGLRHYEDISLGSIGEAAKSIRLQLEDGKDLSEAFDQITSKYDNAIKSTLKVVMDTGSWEPSSYLFRRCSFRCTIWTSGGPGRCR